MKWRNTEQAEALENQICHIENELIPPIHNERVRFPTRERLINRFQKAAKDLRLNGLPSLSHFFETQNELCVATRILTDKSLGGCIRLEYEPSRENCDNRFDFEVDYPSGPRRIVEVKTLHPRLKNDWDKFVRDRDQGRFPDRAKMVLDETWMGGEIYHQAYAVRSKILEYTIEMETKLSSCLTQSDSVISFLVFFSNGFDWHPDELEDFVCLYRYGKHHPGDPFGKMERHHLDSKRISLRRNIQHFGFMERKDLAVNIERGSWSVHPPDPMVPRGLASSHTGRDKT